MKGHIEGFSKGVEEVGCELRSSVGGDMLGMPCLENTCVIKRIARSSGTMNSCRNEFSELVNNH